MTEPDDLLKTLWEQESELRFTTFTADMALSIGLDIIAAARTKEQAIAVDVTVQGLQVFHFAMAGTTVNNSDWIRRKSNATQKLGHSSFYLHTLLRSKGQTLQEAYDLPTADYAAEGGAFPITTYTEGVIGTITVSGLAGSEDHACVVAAIKNWLSSNP